MTKRVKPTSSKPSAWVVNSSDRGRKSIKNDKVYLNDKEEFQIELYNPLQKCVLVDIKLNGSSISNAGLVLNPGQRYYLDCFIEDKKKFIFSTYDVDNNDETKEAIAKNGLLEVYFYEETIMNLQNWGNIRINPQPTWWGGYNGNYYNSITGTISIGSTTSGTNIANANVNYTGSGIASNMTNVSNLSLDSTRGKSLETGRVDKGDTSKQKFEAVDMNFGSNVISSTIIHLLPESRKPIETKDIKRPTYESDMAIDVLTKLGCLYRDGVLTEEEFKEKKAEWLQKI